MLRRKKSERDSPDKEAEEERIPQDKRFKYSMEDENERDIQEDSVVGSDIETDSEDFNTVEGLSCDSTGHFVTPYDHYVKVLKRTLPEPVCDEDMVVLSWNDSDLNLVIDEKTFSAACPLHWKGFCFLQGGVRATHGFTSGRVCFEVKITSLCNIKFIDGHLNTHLIRIGWSPYSTSLALGSDRKSYGYDSNGRASTKGEIKDYGKTLSVGDVIGAYLDLNEKPITISFTVNGEDQGIAYTVPHFELNNEALFPHILSKNIAFECNFGSECTWFTPKKGYTFVDDMPLKERVPGPRSPKNKADCEVIMMIGLPRSGKTTWAREFCARNSQKYYIIDVMNLVDKMEIMDPFRKAMYLRKSHVLGKLFNIAVTRCRNYILDQVNATRFEWQWKMRLFKHFQRRAIVSVIPDDEFERRIKKEPLDKGHDWLMLLKARISLPQPSYLLNRIDYVGLPFMEAEKLLKRYNREAWEKGYMPHKHFVVPSYIFQKKNKKKIFHWKTNVVGKGRIADPVGGPSRSGRISPLRKTTNMQMLSLRKEQFGSATAFVPGGIHNESSLKQFQGELRNRNPNFQGDVDHPRRRHMTPELEPNRRWSPPARNIADWPPGQTLTQWASSLSPPRNVASGRGFPPQDRGRKDFYEGASRQDARPLQSEGHGGWRPPNRGSNYDFSPSRGGGRQVNELVERGRHVSLGFSQRMQERKMLDCAGPQEGRVELGFQTQNRPASFSPNRRGSVQCDPEFEDFHPQRRVSGQLSQNLRHGDGFPSARELNKGEEKDCAPRQRMGDCFPSHGSRDSNVGFQHMGGQIGETFPPPDNRMYNRCSPTRKRERGASNVLEDRRGRFPEMRESRPPLKERYQEERNEFPSLEERQRHSYSPLRDQRRSRGQEREDPFNEKRMSVQDLPPGQGRGDSPAYRENRMGDEPIHHGARTSNTDLPIHRERMVLSPGDKPGDDMYSNVPDMLPQEGRLFDGSRCLARNEGRDHPASDGLARGSRGVRNLPKRETGLGSNLHPHRTRSLSPHREERPGGWLPSEVGHFGGNQPVKPEISDWNRTRQPNRELPDRKGYPERVERPPEDKWGRQSSPVMDQLWDSKCLLNKEEKRTHGDLLNHPIKLEQVGDGDVTSYSGMSDVLSNRFEEDRKNPQSMVKKENWKGASSHSSCWQSSSEIRDWIRGPSNISPVKELPFQNRRDNINQPGSASRPHEFPSDQWNPPHIGPKGHSPPHRRSRWGSRSPELRERIGPKDGPDHRGFPRSRSPVHGLRRTHSRGSPVHNRRLSPRGSPDRGPLGSPAHGSRDLLGRGTRRSPDWGARNSPSQGCRRSPGPGGWGGRGSPDQFKRGSPVQYRRDSPIRGSGGFSGPGTRGSPIEHYRGSLSRDSGGPRIPGARGSPIRRSRSPISGPSCSSGRVRRGSPNRGSLGPPDRNVRGSPIPWNNSPSSMSMTRTRHHLPDIERRGRSPRRAGYHSPTGGSGSNWPHGEGMNRFNQQEFLPHYDPSLNLPQNTDRGSFAYDREGNAENNWSSGEFRDQNEFNQQRFMRHHLNERIPRDFGPTSNVDIVRPFVHDRLGPKLPDEDMIVPYEGGPVVGAGSWEPPGDDVRMNQSPHGSSSGGSCWERRVLIVPGSESANLDHDELAPYEQPFTQALWDSNDPQGGTLEFPRNDPLLTEDNRGNDQERPPDTENRGNVWARVGGYVNDDNDPREGARRPRDPHPSQDRRSPPRSVSGSSRRGMSREREGKQFFRKSSRRSPGRRHSPPGRSSHWKSKLHAPYPERRRTPPKSGPRSHWKSPPRKRDWRSPLRRRGLRSPPRRW